MPLRIASGKRSEAGAWFRKASTNSPAKMGSVAALRGPRRRTAFFCLETRPSSRSKNGVLAANVPCSKRVRCFCSGTRERSAFAEPSELAGPAPGGGTLKVR